MKLPFVLARYRMIVPPFLFFKQFLKVQLHISTGMAKNGQHLVSKMNSDKYMTSQVFFRAKRFLLKKGLMSPLNISLMTKPGASWCFQVS